MSHFYSLDDSEKKLSRNPAEGNIYNLIFVTICLNFRILYKQLI